MEEGAIDIGGVGCRLDAFDLVIFDVAVEMAVVTFEFIRGEKSSIDGTGWEGVGKRGDRFWAVKVHAKVQFALSASRT